MNKSSILLGAAVFVIAIGLALLLRSSSLMGGGVSLSIPTAEACDKQDPGDCLPDIALMDMQDRVWTRESMTGKVVMVNFWATWCKPCKAEIPALAAAYKDYSEQGFVLLGVMTDAEETSDEELRAFSEAHGLNYPVIPVDPDIWYAFNAPDALPTTYIYDRAGRLRLHHRGPLSESQLAGIVEELMGEGSSPDELAPKS